MGKEICHEEKQTVKVVEQGQYRCQRVSLAHWLIIFGGYSGWKDISEK